ncbi:hypothetical protein [Rhizobium sp. LC145]|jgi:hypothetical protein|uniref:hypothetical protein n=1 Tax=Rhizobium sp. LC145 TaxID=1120688 RepID=UPI000629F7D4|nr:hypothetical protein [Rhizobium sp. LC145]KKX34256.1 hypothetical protein YH62_03605 [Rhizobium sp. LC145]TKT45987.1 hypothetical protein FDR95_24445 [Rhizobiaceae bacterium LC148]
MIPDAKKKGYRQEQTRENKEDGGESKERTRENITYIRDMLRQLRNLAEGEDMLCYLIEMAYVEAGDLHAGGRFHSG